MATGKITKRSVEAVPLPLPGKRAHLWDDTLKGFGVMVTDRGVRSYIIQYRVGGRGNPTRRVTIGKHGSPWTAERARDRAAGLLEQVRLKVDPYEATRLAAEADRAKKVSREAEAAVAERLGFSIFADRYLEKYAKVKQERSWQETERVLRVHLKPAFGNRLLTEIAGDEIVELIDGISERSRSNALKAYGALRLIFKFATQKERRYFSAAQSPMLGLEPPEKVKARERRLNNDELRLVWIAAGGIGWPFGTITRLLILTGQRKNEVAGLPWPEMDQDSRSWLLPAARAKNKRENFIPLSDQAIAIINDLPVLKGDAQLLFTTTGTTAVTGMSKAKDRMDRIMLNQMRLEAEDAGASADEIGKLQVAHWTLHDLRRTVASGLQQLRIPTEVTESILNHKSGTQAGIVGVYQTYKYQDEKREALAAWGKRVMEIVTAGSTVSTATPVEIAA